MKELEDEYVYIEDRHRARPCSASPPLTSLARQGAQAPCEFN